MDAREKWLTAIAARLERVRATEDLSPVLEPSVLREIRSLVRLLRENVVDLEAHQALGWLHWYRANARPGNHGGKDLDAAVNMFASCFIFGADEVDVPKPLLPLVAEQAVPTALFWQDYGDTNLDLVSNTMRLWQRILAAIPADHPNRGMMLANLALVLKDRFGWTEDQSDLDQAIEVAERAVGATPTDDSELADRLHILGDVLWIRYKRTDESADLDALIATFNDAVTASSVNHPDRATYLSKLGVVLRHRFEASRRPADIDAAVQVGKVSVEVAGMDDATRARCLNNLGNALKERFEHAGALADLDAAITAFKRVTEISTFNQTDRSKRLDNLGNALRTRFEHSGDLADLDAAITAFEEAAAALSVDHPGRTIMLADLRDALRTRFEQTGQQADLEAVSEADRAIRETVPTATSLLHNVIGSANLHAISAAVDVWRDIVAATPADHPDHAGYSNNLALSLRIRYERTGVPADLDAAIAAFGNATKTAPDDDSANRASYLSNLGNALRRRFERTGALPDADAAVEASRTAVQTTPAGTASWAWHANNLGSALRARFVRTRDLADLDQAIELRRAAIDVIPDGDPDRMTTLTNLGTALLIRYEHTGHQADVDAAVEAARPAAETDHPGRVKSLDLLGIALGARYGHTGDRTDLDAAIEASQTAAEALPGNHPDRALYLTNLATGLLSRFQDTGTSADRDSALSAYAQAAENASAPPSIRIHAAAQAASLAAQSQPHRAAALLETAVRLLPHTAPRQLHRSDQQFALSQQAGLAGDAAALALADPDTPAEQRAARALRLLDAGRAVLLSQALATRSDLTDLREHHPQLATRFTELRDLLDQPMPVADVAAAEVDQTAQEHDRATRDRDLTARELDAILAEIRALPGFASFALPPAIEELLDQAIFGPVVIFNVSTYRSDALLLTGDGMSSVELPDLGFDHVEDMVNVFHLALHVASAPDASSSLRRDAQTRLHGVLQWLWDVAAGPVLHALGYEGGQPSGAGPRVWWAPGGMLGLLPLHAAGYHDDPPDTPGRRTVMDRVISSYTPTIGALRHARQHTRAPDGAAQGALIVAMPSTPGVAGRLHHVPDEVAVLRTHMPESVLLIEPDPPAEASAAAHERIPTRANVLARLPECPIAHFACHGDSHPTDPSQSLLLLHDHETAPLTVASLAAVDLDQAQLAYLSACRTAVSTAPGLFDEAIHLTSALQLAGFPHVVGTLWEINDALAVTVAESFYTALHSESGKLDPGRAAQALHQAVSIARDQFPRTPSLWAAYLHAGA